MKLTEEQIVNYLIRFGLESVVVCISLFFIFRCFSKSTYTLSTFKSICICSIFIAFGLAQIFDRFQYQYPQPYGFFPFARFAMYQVKSPYGYNHTYRIIAENKSGIRKEIIPQKTLQAVGIPSVSSRFKSIVRQRLAHDLAAKDELENFAKYFASILKAENFSPRLIELQILDIHPPKEPRIIKRISIYEST